MKKLFPVFLIIIISSNVFSQDIEKVKAKIEENNKIYIQAMMDNDMEKMMSLYTEDIISMPSYQPMVRGINKVRELSDAQKDSEWKTTKFVLNTTDVFVAGNLAIEIGNYEMVMSSPGIPDWPDNGKYITIWEEEKDGSLKIKVETWNTDTSPWEQMEKVE